MCKYANMQINKYADKQVCKCASMQVSKYANLQKFWQIQCRNVCLLFSVSTGLMAIILVFLSIKVEQKRVF